MQSEVVTYKQKLETTDHQLLNPATKMPFTKQRPTSASFATQQQRVRRDGSVSNFNAAVMQDDYPMMMHQQHEKLDNRVPVRILFKNESLEKLAGKNLSSRVVMALQSLTIKQFIAEVLTAMRASKSVRRSRIEVVFYGKS